MGGNYRATMWREWPGLGRVQAVVAIKTCLTRFEFSIQDAPESLKWDLIEVIEKYQKARNKESETKASE